jgi:iron(III) transport system substrate-binding protein
VGKNPGGGEKEGKVVVGIPPSSELRKELEPAFKARFGFEVELFAATGPQIANRVVTEGKAGVRYFDTFIFGSCTGVPLIKSGLFDQIEPYMILPEVKDPKHWWGGHVWMDNVSGTRLFYSFIATKSSEGVWYNTTLAKAEELRSFDDLLDSEWKGKIGLSDPRVAGSGLSVWSYLWDLKGEEYLKKLVQQELFVSQNLRQLAEALAKGRLAIALGIGVAQTDPFVKAGLPVKDLPEPREGTPSSNGYGSLAIIKNPPHPNATKIFINWLVSKGRPRNLQPGPDARHAAPGRGHQMDGEAGRGSGQGCSYGDRQRTGTELFGRQVRRSQAAVPEVCRKSFAMKARTKRRRKYGNAFL